jgi:hypothetical protein
MKNRHIPVLTKEELAIQKIRQRALLEKKKLFQEAKKVRKTNERPSC